MPLTTPAEFHAANHAAPDTVGCVRCDAGRRRCEEKVQYRRRKDAIGAAIWWNQANGYDWDRPLQAPYHCVWCTRWHLTSDRNEPGHRR